MELLGEFAGVEARHALVGHDASAADDDGAGAHGFDLLHDVGGEEDGLVLANLADDADQVSAPSTTPPHLLHHTRTIIQVADNTNVSFSPPAGEKCPARDD